MPARGTGILAKAIADHTAVPAFTTYNLEMVQAFASAVEQTSQPAIMLAGSSHFHHAGQTTLISIALQAAHDSTATIGVHLDRCRALAEIEQCVKAGYSSVMVDGPQLPFEDNIELTRAAVALDHPAGAWMEAELGAVPGDEDVSTTAAPAQTMTDPREAAEFVERTGVDALGNVHGLTATPVPLDSDRLAAIKAAVPVPLGRWWATRPAPRRSHPPRRRQDQHQHRATPGLPRRRAAALAAVLSTHDSVALWRAPRSGDHRRRPLHPRLVRNQLGNPSANRTSALTRQPIGPPHHPTAPPPVIQPPPGRENPHARN
jgi:tagatose 1,6-diphosphate aldolase GatY/KbaY